MFQNFDGLPLYFKFADQPKQTPKSKKGHDDTYAVFDAFTGFKYQTFKLSKSHCDATCLSYPEHFKAKRSVREVVHNEKEYDDVNGMIGDLLGAKK